MTQFLKKVRLAAILNLTRKRLTAPLQTCESETFPLVVGS